MEQKRDPFIYGQQDQGSGYFEAFLYCICLSWPYKASLEVLPYYWLGVGVRHSDHHLQLHLSLTVLDRSSDLEHWLLSQPKNAKIHKGKAKSYKFNGVD